MKEPFKCVRPRRGMCFKTFPKGVDFLFYGRCPEGIGRHNVKMSFPLSLCHFVMSHFSDWSKEGMLHHRGGHWGGWARQRQHICCIRKTRAELCHTQNPTKKNIPPKFTYSDRIRSCAQFLILPSSLRCNNLSVCIGCHVIVQIAISLIKWSQETYC